MGNKLYVGNLAYNIRDDDLQQAFAQYGTVSSAKVMMDRDTGRSKGFGFVEMGSDPEAQAAINGMNGQALDGRAIVVNEARPREERPGGFGGGGGRSGGGGGYGGGGGGRTGGGGGGYGGGGGGYGGGGGGRTGGGGGYGGGGGGRSGGGGGGSRGGYWWRRALRRRRRWRAGPSRGGGGSRGGYVTSGNAATRRRACGGRHIYFTRRRAFPVARVAPGRCSPQRCSAFVLAPLARPPRAARGRRPGSAGRAAAWRRGPSATG